MKINKKQKYIYLIIFNVSAFIVNYFLPNIFANLINVLIFILLIKFWCNNDVFIIIAPFSFI